MCDSWQQSLGIDIPSRGPSIPVVAVESSCDFHIFPSLKPETEKRVKKKNREIVPGAQYFSWVSKDDLFDREKRLAWGIVFQEHKTEMRKNMA